MNLPLLLLVALLGMGTQSQLVFGEISSQSTMGANPHHPEDEPRDPATGLPKPGSIPNNSEDRNSEEPKESLDIKDSKAVSKALDEVFKDPETAEAKLSELLSKLSPEDEENLRKLVNEQYQESISRFQEIKDQTPPPKKEFESAEKEYQKWKGARSELSKRKEAREKGKPPSGNPSELGPAGTDAATGPAPAEESEPPPRAPGLPSAASGKEPKEISEKIGAGSTLGDGRKIKPADDVENIRAFLVEKEAGSNHFVYVSEKGVSVDEQGKLTADLAHGVRFHDEKARTADMTFTDRESGATYPVNAQTGTTEVADPKTRIISSVTEPEKLGSGVRTLMTQFRDSLATGSGRREPADVSPQGTVAAPAGSASPAAALGFGGIGNPLGLSLPGSPGVCSPGDPTCGAQAAPGAASSASSPSTVRVSSTPGGSPLALSSTAGQQAQTLQQYGGAQTGRVVYVIGSSSCPNCTTAEDQLRSQGFTPVKVPFAAVRHLGTVLAEHQGRLGPQNRVSFPVLAYPQ